MKRFYPAFYLVFLIGCAQKPWETSRSVILAAAEGVAQANVAVVDRYQAGLCPDALPGTEQASACLESLEAQVNALDLARDSLLVGEGLVDTWRDLRVEPENWGSWSRDMLRTVARLVELLRSSGVPIPEGLVRLTAMLGGQ